MYKSGKHLCTIFDVYVAGFHPGVSKCVECGKEHSEEEIREAVFRAIREFNPYHDDLGRFTTGPRSSSKKKIPSYKDAASKFQKFSAMTKFDEYTYRPSADKGYNVKLGKEKAREFHKDFAKGKDDDVVVIAVINNKSDLNEKTEEAYNKMVQNDEEPLIGVWRSKTGEKFTDISTVRVGLDTANIKKLLSSYDQEQAMIVTKEGEVDFIHAD